MRLSSLKILGYRGFSHEQTIRFAQPTGKAGSGLSVIVGANNSGKSAIIEALSYLRLPGQGVNFSEGQRNSNTNGFTRIEYSTNVGTLTLAADGALNAAWAGLPSTSPAASTYVLESRRTIDYSFQLQNQTRQIYTANKPDFSQRQQNYGTNFSARLGAIKQNQKEYDKILSRVLRDPPRWYVEKNSNGQHYIKVTGASASHSSEGLGSGVLSLLQIIDALYDSTAKELIVIDEPELSLHPTAQKQLAILLSEYSSTRQIIIATHSAFFAPFEYLGEGATIARVYQRNRSSVIDQISTDTSKRLVSLLRNRNNPHILGLDARQVLFLDDDIVLTEGQEDVLVYKPLFESLEIDIPAYYYGWGVGGATNMPIIAALLHDLGFERVAGLLDSGQESTLEKLKEKFPKYHFHVIPASDIRTRQPRQEQARSGLLDENGNLRDEHHNSIVAIAKDLRAYFQNSSAS